MVYTANNNLLNKFAYIGFSILSSNENNDARVGFAVISEIIVNLIIFIAYLNHAYYTRNFGLE